MQNAALWYRQFGDPLQTLQLEIAALPPLPVGSIRVRMDAVPVNPSDLIPITGAYRHRVIPPLVAGYEGVGTVIAANGDHPTAIGQRVLPVRGPGTWQAYVDISPKWAVPVPGDITDEVAAQGYINPLTALMMLKKWPVRGKHLLLTAASAPCARLLGQWALAQGARSVTGIYRSPNHKASLQLLGIVPLATEASELIALAASRADIAFDAVGGELAASLLAHMDSQAVFVSYGLLSGQPIAICPDGPIPQRFHLRDYLAVASQPDWQERFEEIWPLLRRSALPDTCRFPLSAWKDALAYSRTPGRKAKPLLMPGAE